eukprot:365737-Chlamydomonas_euryale.AAC.3
MQGAFCGFNPVERSPPASIRTTSPNKPIGVQTNLYRNMYISVPVAPTSHTTQIRMPHIPPPFQPTTLAHPAVCPPSHAPPQHTP